MADQSPPVELPSETLTPLEHIRKRPAMYLGGTDSRALQNCVEEILASICQKHLRACAGRIEVAVNRDGSISIGSRNGESSNASHTKRWLNKIEMEFRRWPSARSASLLGENGVGPFCVNAVSEWLVVQIADRTRLYRTSFRRGVVSDSFKSVGRATGEQRYRATVRFKPDKEIFRGARLNLKQLAWRLREIAFLRGGLEIRLDDRREAKRGKRKVELYFYPGGLADFIRETPRFSKPLHDAPLIIKGHRAGISAEIGIQFNESENSRLLSYVNLRPTRAGGTDVEGLLAGIAAAINTRRFDKCTNYARDFARKGVDCVLSVNIFDPKYYGATKERLLNPEVFDAVRIIAFDRLREIFDAKPELHKSVLLHLDGIKFWTNQMREDGYRP